MRAYSLLEISVTVAIMSVIAALALPDMTPEVQKAQLATAVDAVASFVAAARDDAVVSRRCTRIRIPENDLLVMETANSLTCEERDDVVPRSLLLDPAAPAWIETRRLRLESPRLQADFVEEPVWFPGRPQLRFRSNGRVYAADDTPDDDHVAFELVHPRLLDTRSVLVLSNGFICVPPPGLVRRGDPFSAWRCER